MKGLYKNLPGFLSAPVPFSSVLDMKIPLPALLETPVSISSTTARARRYLKDQRKSKRRAKVEARSHPTSFALQGRLEAGKETPYSIEGHDIRIGPDAWIFGEVSVGVHVKVSGVVEINGTRCATKVTVL